MANEYKSFYLKDVVDLINATLPECMMTPLFGSTGTRKTDGTPMTLAEIANYNSAISLHNEGARELAERLKDRLQREDDPDD